MDHDLSNLDLKHIFTDRDSIDRDSNFILKLHLVPASGLSLEEAALRVLLILTGRTMRVLPYEPPHVRLVSSGNILEIDEGNNTAEIALPRFLCRPEEGLTHLVTMLTSAAEYSYCNEYWLDNIEVPKPYVTSCKGPRFGVSGIRNLFHGTAVDRPIIGLIVKPRRGVKLSEITPYLEEALQGGCDFLADDLLLVDPADDYSFKHRLTSIVATVGRCAAKTKRPKLYFVNISTNPSRAQEHADQAIEAGADGLIANGFSMGFGGLQDIVDFVDGRVPVITCNMGSGIFTRPRLLSTPGKSTGMSETVVSKLSRLAGADGVHAGTSASECYGADAWGPATRALRTQSFHLKPSIAVAEGDLNLANLWDNIRSLGRDVLLEPTSGILSAPCGPRRAATAFRDLSDSLHDGMTDREAHKAIQEYALHGHHSVAELLDYCGYTPPKD